MSLVHRALFLVLTLAPAAIAASVAAAWLTSPLAR
jgi:hypothetical protein